MLKATMHIKIRITMKLNSEVFDAKCGKYNFSCQLYSLKNIVGLFFKNYLKNLNSFNKNKFFIGQCYLNSNYSGKINISVIYSIDHYAGLAHLRRLLSSICEDFRFFEVETPSFTEK